MQVENCRVTYMRFSCRLFKMQVGLMLSICVQIINSKASSLAKKHIVMVSCCFLHFMAASFMMSEPTLACFWMAQHAKACYPVATTTYLQLCCYL